MARRLRLALAFALTLSSAACQGTPFLGPQECPMALLEGTLVEEPAGTLAVDTTWGETVAVRWPDGVTVAQTEGGPVLVGFFGQTIAREGEFVSVGGGEFDGAFQVCGEIRFEPVGS
jgi:hypothetical protein